MKKNGSSIYLTQSYYSVPLDIRKNCDYSMFSIKLYPREIHQIIREIDGNLTKKEFAEKFNLCLEANIFFMLDLVNPEMRYRRNFEQI